MCSEEQEQIQKSPLRIFVKMIYVSFSNLHSIPFKKSVSQSITHLLTYLDVCANENETFTFYQYVTSPEVSFST